MQKNNWFQFVLAATLLGGFVACKMESEGEKLYSSMCANCHMADGSGLKELIPPLSVTKMSNDRQRTVCLIRKGKNDTITGRFMPSFTKLTDSQIANVLNYVLKKNNENVLLYTDKEIRLMDCRQ